MNDHESIWQRIAEWWHLLWHHAQAGTLPPAPAAGGEPVTIAPVGSTVTPPAPPLPQATALPDGFRSYPDENGYVQLTEVEMQRMHYLRCGDADYEVWAKDLPRKYAIADTLTAFKLTPAQETKLRTDIAQANFLLGNQGSGDWAFTQAANLPYSAAFSDGNLMPDTRGVHLRNLAEALAHQRAHAKAIGAGTNPGGTGAVAGPVHGGGGRFRNPDGSWK